MQTEPEQPLIRLPGLAQLLAAFFWLSLLLMFIPLGLGPLTPHINRFIPLFLEDAGLLAAFTHHSHIVDYAPVDSLSCRLPASSMILGI